VSATEYEVTILIIWSQFFHFKRLWNLQTCTSLVTKQAPKTDHRSWYWHYKWNVGH